MKKLKKVLKIILIIILILVALILINAIRNYTIVRKLQKNIEEYLQSNNYHIEMTSDIGDNTNLTTNYYKKDDNQLVIMDRNQNGENTKVSMYKTGEKTNVFYDTPTEKKVQLDSEVLIDVGIYNVLETENNWQTFLACMFAKITSENYNEKNCYVVENYMSAMSLNGTDCTKYYIEKNTGLCDKVIIDDTTTERKYEFNNVEDIVFAQPNVEEYKVQEDNAQ